MRSWRAAPRQGALLLAAAVVATSAFLAACTSPPESDPRYRPAENLLEVVAVLRRHVPDDTYRFEPARDFTGRNVYRASLLRIENLERAYEESYRSGYMGEVIEFSKGRSLERLRAYDLAAEHYLAAASEDGELRLEALRSASVCGSLHEAASLDPWAAPGDAEPQRGGEVLGQLERREALLEALLVETQATHHVFVVREEIEHADVAGARFLTETRRVHEDGDVLAVGAWQQVVLDHGDSKNRNRHLLELADLYAELASGYVARNPPESLRFDPPTFEELASSATRLYEAVAHQDGATERLEASRRLEAFLAFTLRIDRDRFSR